MYGVCNISVIPLRGEPSEKAEMVSQLLFGDLYSVEETVGNWMKIKTSDCDYVAWMDKKMYNAVHEKDVDNYIKCEKYFVCDYLLFIKDFETNITFPIFAGSSFPYPNEDMLILGNSIFVMDLPPKPHFEGNEQLTPQKMALLRFASTYLQAPYLWGGRTPAGIDCSGFVQVVFKSLDILLPRDASQQIHHGDLVDFVGEAQVGDVAFFDDDEGNIIHVGIVCGNAKIMHASGKVRIDTLDSTGIYNKEAGRYTHRLRLIKRLL